jgi:hypothetical protein
MKRILLILSCLAFFAACKGKEVEQCKAPAIHHNLVGLWTATGVLYGEPIGPAQITFSESGDVDGTAGLLGTVGDARRSDWSVKEGKVLILLDYGSNNTLEFVLPVKENTCRKITLGEDSVLLITLERASST